MKKIKLEGKDYVLLFLGVVLSIIFLPFINFIGQTIINLFTSLSKTFSVFYITKIALNDANELVYWIGGMMMCILVVFLFLYYINLTYRDKNIESNIIENASGIDKVKEVIESSSNFHTLMLRFKVIIIIQIILIWFVFLFVRNVDKTNVRFQQKVTIIAPFIENQKLLELKSQWSRMKSKEDYIRINNEIKELYKSQ